jgi:hypothetical protein
MGGPGGDDLVAFARALGRLANRWLVWALIGHVGLTVEIGGRDRGFHPLLYVLDPLVLLALRDLRAAAPDPVARALTPVLAIGVAGTAVELIGPLVAGGGPPTMSGLGWPVVVVGLALFSRAMVRWARIAAPESERSALVGSWRRSMWASWLALAAGGALVVGRLALVAAAHRPLDDAWSTVELEGGGSWVVFLALAVVLVGPLFWVAGSTGRTRRALTPPTVVMARRPVPGARG